MGHNCDQGAVHVEKIDQQVVAILKQLTPPKEWRKHITRAMSEVLGERDLEKRLAEIRDTIERMDFRWDQGFIADQDDYIEKRLKLQQELEQLTPIPEDDLERAADMLENFAEHWEAAEDDTDRQHELVKLIVERVYVDGEDVVAITLKADYHIVMDHNGNRPTEVPVDLSAVYTSGSDGDRSTTCIRSIAFFPRHVATSYFKGDAASIAVVA